MPKDFANSYKQMVWKHHSSEYANNCCRIRCYREALAARSTLIEVSKLNEIYAGSIKILTARNEELKQEFPGIEMFEE